MCKILFYFKKNVRDSLSGCFHQFVSFLMHMLKSLLYPCLKKKKLLEIVKTRTHNLWMVSIIYENLDPRVLLLCYASAGYTRVSEVPY